MDRRSKIIIGLFAVVILGIIITEVTRTKPINWRPSYTAQSKTPFGGYVLFNELQQLFPKSEITKVDESLFYVMEDRDTTVVSSYVLINDHINLDEQELHRLLDFAAQGNSVFLAASDIDYKLRDTLNLRIDYDYTIVEDTITVEFTNTQLNAKKYQYSRGVSKSHLISVDTINTTILGYLEYGRLNDFNTAVEEIVRRPNFIKTAFGKGDFFINTTPQAFSNYYLLKGNDDYLSGAFAYLGDYPIYYDNYKKSGRVVITSPMRFVLNQTALKWAYYSTIVGLLLFVVFRAKREQRIIPVVTPLENSSVEFARTVGSLYHQNKDYTNLISKKIRFFLAHLRHRYYVNTETLTEKTFTTLASKSGKTVEECKKLIEYIIHLKNKAVHSEADLIELNKKITAFKS